MSDSGTKYRLQAGDRAPDFDLPDQDGNRVTLTKLVAGGPVVLYFYPRDETAGCTAEACAFRDSYEVFRDVGAQVVGVSSDSSDSHARFSAHHRLPFTLLSDAHGALRRAFGVPASLGILPGRVTYVIGSDQIIRKVFSSQLNPQKHIKEALAALNEMTGAESV